MNNKIREGEKYLKRVLKGKMSVTEGLSVSFMIAGFFGLSSDSEAAWTTQPLKIDGANNSRISIWDADGRTGDGSVILTRSDRINKELVNSVVIGTGGNVPGQSGTLQTQKLAIDIEGYDPSNNGFNSGIVAIGSVRVQSNPHGVGRTGTGGQAVAIGNDVTSTSQAVAIGNNTYALGGSSIAIGNDDIETYRDKVTAYDYKNYLKPLYDKIDPGRNAYGIGDAGNAIYSPNVAGGEGSISIGSRSVAYKPGSTALGTLAYALGQGATALGTQSRAEGTGSIAIGNETRNFANQALAIGNDSQILATGGTAVGLRARSGGEGSIAIGTDVYANAAMNNTPNSPMDVQHSALKNRVMGTNNLSSVESTVSNSNTINPTVDYFHDIGGIIKGNGKNALVIGTRSAALGSNSIALGRGAFAMEDNSFGIGSYSYANKMNSMAIGTSSRALAENAVTLGAGSVTMTDAKSSTVIGTKSAVAGENSSLVGSNSQIYGSNSLIFGNNTNILKNGSSSSNNNVAIGNDISIGSGVTNSMAYGSGAMVGDKNNNNNNISNSTAFGNGASVIRQYTGPTVENMSPATIKNKAVADPMFMYTGNNAMAIGNNSQATLENSVALGVNSSTDYTYLDLLQPGWTARGSIAIPTSGQTGVISVGSKGAERRIVNVASGFRDTDAVNVIQLRTLEEKIDSRVDGIESGMHYLSVNKKGSDSGTLQGSETVTELIERRKNYDLYLRYKTQELQIKAREEWKGEKFDTDSKKKITDKIAEIEAADTTGLIRHTASDLRNITVTALPSGADIQAEYTKLVKRIDDAVKTSTTDAKYTALVGGVNIEDLQNETNYSNKGANGTDSLAIGFRASTKKDTSVDSKQAIAMGYRASAENVNALAIGSVGVDITKASGISSIAIGNGTQTTSNYSVGLGGNAQVKGDTSIAIGDRTLTTASRATAVGPAAKGLGTNSVALGASAETGFLSKTETNGDKTYTGANYSTAIGGGATVYSNYSVAIGNGATVGETVTTSGVTTLKTDTKASVVLGSGSKSTAEGGTVLGADAKATFKNSVALGRNVTTTESDGKSYLTNRDFKDKGYVVSVGNRRINQVEDGAEDTDAVNVRQLKKLEEKTLTTDNAKITIAPDQNGTKEFTLGSTINLTTADAWGQGDNRFVGDNIETYKKNDGSILIGVKENPKFKTLKLNNGNGGAQDLTLSADNAGNLNVGSKKITGVADGTENNDAVNYSQLNTVKLTADTAKTTAEAAKGTAEAAKTKAADVETKLTQLGNKQLTFAANSGNVTRKLGETIGIKGDNSTISTSAANNEITIKVKDGGIGTNQLANGAVTEAKLADNAVTTGKIKDGAVTGAKLADKTITAGKLEDDLNTKINNANKVASNTIRFTGDKESVTAAAVTKTSDVALNKDGGIEFAINGKSGEIVTKASGTKVEIGLDSTIKAKLDKLSTDPNATYATKDEIANKANKNLDNIETPGKNVIKDQAREAVVVAAGNGIAVETTKDDNNHTTKYTVKINDTTMNKIGTGEVAANDENTVTGGKVNTYLTQNYLTKQNVTGTVKAADGSPITVKKGTNDSNGKEYTIDVTKSDITGTGGITVTNGEGKALGTGGVQLSIADKAITFNKLDNDLQTKINSITNNASTLNIGSGITEETVNLLSERVKINGTDGVEVKLNNKEFTVGLTEETKKKIAKVGNTVADGIDGQEGKNGTNGANGLTAKDGLNGKDLTTKVNALRNGEAGTVVFTDPQGNRLVKANNGKYYPVADVAADGNVKPGVDENTGITNPELRVVNADGSTTTPNTLNNLASGLGLDGKKPGTNPEVDYAKPITVEDAQTVVKGLAAQTEGLNKAATVRDLQALTNAGLTFEANTVGDTKIFKVDRKLGETLKITGDGIKVSKNATNDGFVFSLSKGKVETVNVKDKAVTSAKLAEDARTVVYITPDNKVVELGADGKLHKAEDLQGKTYVVVKTPEGTIDEAKTGYYSDNDVNADGELKTATAQKLETPAVVDPAQTRLRHALNGYTAGGTDITTKSVLTNVGAGNIAADSTDAINGSQLKDVADKVGLTVGTDNKTLTFPALTGLKDAKGDAGAAPQSIVTGLNAVTAKVNEGIKYKGDLGNEGTQQLGTVFNVNRAGTGVELKDGTKQTISKIVPVPAGSAEGTLPTIGTEEIDRKYVGKNIITQYTKDAETGNGKLEIGFAESPEFKNVKADNVTTGSIVFDDGSGKKLSLGPTSDGKLQVGGKEISTELVLSKDGSTEAGKVDLAKQKLHVEGKNEVEVEISGQKVTVGLNEATKQKLENLDTNAKDTYAKKDATNIDAAKWKEKLGLSNAVSGTGKLAIDTATKGTATGATAVDGGKAEVSLDGTQNFKMIGTEGVTVSANDKNITFGLDPETINKINNAGSKKDGKDGKNGANALNGTNGDAGASGNHGLTAKDGLNGKDLTTKVNALRNGEAGTVVFTDPQGNRLVKANNGKYYPVADVAADGNVKPGVDENTGITNPELRVVNADGSTTTPNTLSNIANGKIDANSKDAINGSQIKDVLDKLGVETDANTGAIKEPTITALNKADGTADTAKTTLKDGLNAVIGKVNEGIKYKGNLGDEGKQQLGTVFNVVRAGRTTETGETPLTETVGTNTINYVGDNVITKYTRNNDGNGKLEIGFKESPTFKDVKADKVTITGDITAGGTITGKDGKFETVKVTEKITTKEIEFKDGTGNNLTLVSGKDGNLYINGVAVPSAANAPVIYTNTNGERVELGQDGKVYKPSDLTGFTYVKGVSGVTDGYYADNQFQKDASGAFIKDNEGNKVLKTGEQPTTLLTGKDYTGEVLHRLSPLSKTDNNPRRLVNVAAGKDNTDAVNVGQLNALKTNTIKLDGNTGSTDTQELGKENGLSFGIKGTNGIETSATGTDVTVKLSDTYKTKLDNLDDNAKDTYAKKDASNLANLSDTDKQAWRNAIGLGSAVSGTGTLSIDAATKGTAAGATEVAGGKATVKLNGTENFKLVGTDGITVSGSDEATNKTLTFGLDQATKDAIKNIGKSISDGRDGLDGTNGHNGSHGLTAKDGLNGKDLTDKVNALRNGEAGTVVFTDAAGNRLVKANDGKYYKPEFVSPDGSTKANENGDQPVAVDNPELRVVNADGSTTTPNTLNNLASGLGLDGKKPGTNPEVDYAKPITVEDAQTVVKGLAAQTEGLNKAATVRDLQAVAQAGLDFTGNAGTVHRALGTTLKIVGKEVENFDETKFNADYSTENVATNVKDNGTVEIGFKKSPTFDNVKAKNIEALNGKFENLKVKEKIETKEIIFKTATGNNVTIATGKDGNLYINGVAVPTAETAPVIYANEDGERVELGQDGKVYKPEDLKHLTYVAAKAGVGNQGDPNYVPAVTAGYYADNKFEKEDDGVTFKQDSEGNKILITGATPENLSSKEYTGEVLHKLSPLSKADANPRRLVNVAAGKDKTDAVNVGQLNAVKDLPITFQGDKATDTVTRKLGETLKITGDGVKVTKNAAGDGLVLSIDQGKVQTKNVADQAVTSAKLAQDARTVVYVTQQNEPVELGADNKLYKSSDLQGKTYIVSTDPTIPSGYYLDTDLNPEKTAPLTGKTPAPLTAVNPNPTTPGGQKLKHALNGYIPGGTDVTTNSVLTNVGEGTADNDAVNVKQLNALKTNTIKLTADGVTPTAGGDKTNTVTTALGLDNNGGISFGIKGTANEIETTATGTDVTLKLSKEVTDKLANITAAADGKDGKIGATGNTGATGAMGEKGLTGQDGLNGKDLTTKANALRDGEAGTVVFTDKDGNRLVKANDGKYYKANEVNPDGSLIGTPTAVDTPELRTVNSDGTTTKPVTLNNVASALGLDSTAAEKVTAENAKRSVGTLLNEADKNNLNKVATARDLQAVAQAGLDFKGNTGEVVHRALGTTLNIIGKDVETGFDATKFASDFSTDNVATNVKDDGTIQIGISKKVKFEEVDGDKVKAGEVVLKPTDKTKPEVKLTTDGNGNLVVGDKTITAGPIKLALGGKTVTADNNETTSGGTEADKVDLSAGETLNVIGKDGVTVNVGGKDITLGLDDATKAKLANITAAADGKDGKIGATGNTGATGAMGEKGLTGQDGLNGKDLTTKANALRDGEAGTVVFTDKDGNRLVKANDGKYYKANEVNPDGSLIGTPTAVDTPELRTVNSDGTTTKPVTLNNVASALGLDGKKAGANPTDYDKPISKEDAKAVINDLVTKADGLNKVATARDLQAVAQAGLDFKGNTGEAVHRALGTVLNVVGQGTPAADFVGASGNINVVASEDAANKIAKLEIQLAKALKEIESIQNDKTKITLDENDGVKVDGKDGGKVVVNGKDGNSTVAINGGDGTNGSSVTVNGKDGKDGKDGVTIKGSDGTNGSSVAVNGKDGKDGVTIKGTDGTNGSSIVVNGKDGKPGVTINGGNGTNGKDASITFTKDGDKGTGSITGLKDPELNDDGTPKDPTAATTVNYVTNQINNVTNNIKNAVDKMDKGLNFAGNDNEKVNAKLDDTVTIKGEGTVAGTTAANNIKVEKDTAENSKGLVVKLADKLTEMKGFETKEEDGKKVTINKDGISLTTTGTPGANLKLGTDGTITGVVAKPDDDTSVATVGYIKDKIKTSAGLTLKGDTTNVVNNNSTTNNVQNLGSTLEVKAATEKITAAVKEEKDGKIVAKAGETTTYTGKNLTTTYTLDGTTGTGTISVAMSERPEFEKVTVGTGDKKMTLDGTAGSIEFAKSNPTKEVYADNNGNIIKYKDENGEIKVIERNVGTGSVTGLKDVETVTVDGEKIAIDRTQAATAGYVDEKVADVKNEVRTIVNQVDKNAQRIEEVNKQAKEGIASVAAMATLDFNDAPVGRVGVGAAIGGYRGTQAVAVGAVYGINESFKVNAKMGIPTSRPNGATYGISATYYFDR